MTFKPNHHFGFLATLQPANFRCLWQALLCLSVLLSGVSAAQAQLRCARVHDPVYGKIDSRFSSFREVIEVIRRTPYDRENLPTIPIQIWSKLGNRLSFFVGRRSKEILNEEPIQYRDYRKQGENKPIHPMGIGLTGKIIFYPSKWSGVFEGAEFPVIARASLSQGNPLKHTPDGKVQRRSTALALKIFPSQNLQAPVKTLNAVFQNDLNGLTRADGRALNYLESAQTNQPALNISKISESYEWLTLIGVALGSIQTPKDRMSRFPFMNPQIRPVHSLAEHNVERAEDVRTPVWVQIRPRRIENPLEQSDFRLEILAHMERDGRIIYDLFAGSERDSLGQVQWQQVGELQFNRTILTREVDQNLLFPHDRLNSDFTGQEFKVPDPAKQFDSVPDDIQ